MLQKYVVPGLLFSLLRVVAVGLIFFMVFNIGKLQPLLDK